MGVPLSYVYAHPITPRKKKKKKGVGMEEIIPDPILHVLVTV